MEYMEEIKDKDYVIASLEKQLEEKIKLIDSINNLVSYKEKQINELRDYKELVEGKTKELSDLREELRSIKEKYEAFKYYGRDIEMLALKHEVNSLKDYISKCYRFMHFTDINKLEMDNCYYLDNKRYDV